jgi:hypothetical protein
MTILTDALNRIMSWLERTHPNDVGLFFPGIDKDEVDDVIQEIPNDGCITPEENYFPLPSELYELYKWHNGYKFYRCRYETRHLQIASEILDVFDGKSFFPLSETYIFDPAEINSPCLILFQHDCDGDYLILDLKPPFSLHTHYCNDICSYLTYSNLTALMLTLAEFYESGGNENDVIEFSEEYQRVWLKYNADIGQEAIDRVLRNRWVA